MHLTKFGFRASRSVSYYIAAKAGQKVRSCVQVFSVRTDERLVIRFLGTGALVTNLHLRHVCKRECFKRDPFMMKLDSPEFQALFTPELKNLVEVFNKYGYELRIAGGAVRDLLMHLKPHDVDFASTATPAQMKEMFTKEEIRMLNMKGESHGTITARLNDKENFEITTLRIDVLTDGRRAQVEFTTDWQLDAGRRDLTINSLFLGLDGTVYDYFNGIEDLENRRIKFVGHAVQRIQEDYLRILRYFRFYGRIGNKMTIHDQTTLDAIRENMAGLKGISGERVWSELKKILAGPQNHVLLKTMLGLGLAPFIGLPEHPNVAEFDAMYDRSCQLSPQPVTLIAALLKSEAQLMELNGRIKLSTYERDLGLFVLGNRDRKPCEDELHPYQSLVLESSGKQSDVKEWVEEVLKYRGEVELLNKLREWKVPKFPVNGHDLMSRGISAGYRLSKIMLTMKRRWINSSFTVTKEELLDNLQDFIDEAATMPSPPRKKKQGGQRDSK